MHSAFLCSQIVTIPSRSFDRHRVWRVSEFVNGLHGGEFEHHLGPRVMLAL